MRRDGIEVGELPPDPLEIDLGSHGATIEGVLAGSGSNPPPPMVVALFRRVAEEVLFEKQAYGLGRFTMQGVAPGEYILFAWSQDAQVAFAEPEFMREYGALGKTVQVTEDQRLSVVLDHLLPTMQR